MKNIAKIVFVSKAGRPTITVDMDLTPNVDPVVEVCETLKRSGLDGLFYRNGKYEATMTIQVRNWHGH